MNRKFETACFAGVVWIALASASAQEAESIPEIRLLGPRAADERAAVLRRQGGTKRSEAAVEAGLDWLARHEAEGGGWDADGFSLRCEKDGEPCTGVGKGQHGEDMPCPFDDAISALATLAFLGHGHRPGVLDDPHGELLARALQRLEAVHSSWGRALALQVFAEVEALEGRGRFRDVVDSMAEGLLRRRGEDGAWGYASGFRPGSDVPYSAFVVQALITARDAGVSLPQDLAEGVDRFLDGLEVDKGRIAYLHNGRAYGYTPTRTNGHLAAAMRCLLEVDTKGQRHRAHLALVGREKPVWKIGFRTVDVPGRGPMKVQIGSLSFYQWWYGTLASFQAGGTRWKSWNRALQGALLGHQIKKGCARGSWDPLGTYERQTGGRVLATALAVLMLEQPYRHQRLTARR